MRCLSVAVLVTTIVGAVCVPSLRANSPMLVDGAGRAIGYQAGQTGCGGGIVAVVSKNSFLGCIYSNGYFQSDLTPTGSPAIVSGLYFQSSDCSGDGYVGLSPAYTFTGGFVIATPSGLRMTATNDVSAARSFGSRFTSKGTGCEMLSASGQSMLAPAADAATIGFSVVPYSPLLFTRVLPDSALDDVIFFDGFEVGY